MPNAVQLLVAIACGGLGGAVFTWFVNRRLRLPPVLRLALVRKEGEREKLRRDDATLEDVRYYHLKVSNDRRWSPASNAEVFLTRVEEAKGDHFEVIWVGNIPMRWRNQQATDLTQTVGRAVDCDLCCVGRSNWFALMPMFMPYSLEPLAHRTTSCRIILHLQVRSTQADSDPFCVELKWTGQWSENDDAMTDYLQIDAEHIQSPKL